MDYKNRYTGYRKEVQEQMDKIIDNIEMQDCYITILDLLAMNYDMLFASMDSIKESGFDKLDSKNRLLKNHAIQTFNNTQTTIIKLLNNFPTSPYAKGKIKKVSKEEPDPTEVLDTLLNG